MSRPSSSAKPETVRRRQYHQEYWAKKKFGQNWVKCPTCSGNMRGGKYKQCAECRYRLDRWDVCMCGKRKLRESGLCHGCAGLRGGRPGRVARQRGEPNPFCPNPTEGAELCATNQPHAHCRYCSDPIQPDQGMCADCIRAVERGACMTERDARNYEEAA